MNDEPKLSPKACAPFHVADYLDSPAEVAAFLNELLSIDGMLQQDSGGTLAFALGELAKAHGMPAVAAHTGLTREALYKALRAGATPRWDTVVRVLDALQLELVVQPKGAQRD